LHQADNVSIHAALLCVWHLIASWPTTWESLLLHVAATEQRRTDPDSLFDRGLLIQLAAERVTGAKAARLLGIDVKTINNWVARGVLAPIGDPMVKGRRYLREDVLYLARQVHRAIG